MKQFTRKIVRFVVRRLTFPCAFVCFWVLWPPPMLPHWQHYCSRRHGLWFWSFLFSWWFYASFWEEKGLIEMGETRARVSETIGCCCFLLSLSLSLLFYNSNLFLSSQSKSHSPLVVQTTKQHTTLFMPAGTDNGT